MIGDKEAEGGIVIELKGKGKKDKSDAKAQAKAETTARTVKMSFNKSAKTMMVTVCHPNAGWCIVPMLGTSTTTARRSPRILSTTCLSS